MFSYNFVQWLAFFFIYCFVGWCIESAIVSVTEKRLVNRGFIKGPFLPIYGFGALVILFVSIPVRDHAALVFLFGMIGTTTLEYFTGWLMESIFKMKYWDYSSQRFNYKGRICLTSSLFWGFLSIFLTDILHPPVERFVLVVYENYRIGFFIVTAVISALLLADVISSFKTAADVNKILAVITKLKLEIEQYKEQLKDAAEGSEALAEITRKIAERREQIGAQLEKFRSFESALIEAHPSISSNHFNEALKDVKERLRQRRNRS